MKWKFDGYTGTMKQQTSEMWLLERSGVTWNQKFLIQYNVDRPEQDHKWGSVDQACRFMSRQQAWRVKNLIERHGGVCVSVEGADTYNAAGGIT